MSAVCDSEFADGSRCGRPATVLQLIRRTCGCVADRWASTCESCSRWSTQGCAHCGQLTVQPIDQKPATKEDE